MHPSCRPHPQESRARPEASPHSGPPANQAPTQRLNREISLQTRIRGCPILTSRSCEVRVGVFQGQTSTTTPKIYSFERVGFQPSRESRKLNLASATEVVH